MYKRVLTIPKPGERIMTCRYCSFYNDWNCTKSTFSRYKNIFCKEYHKNGNDISFTYYHFIEIKNINSNIKIL